MATDSLITMLPFCASVSSAKLILSPSISSPKSSISIVSSSLVVALVAIATGASLTGLTITLNCVSTLKREDKSLAERLTWPVPCRFSIKSIVKIEPSKLISADATFSLNDKDKFEPLSTSVNTVDKSISTSSESSFTIMSLTGFNTVGTSFTDSTVNTKIWLELSSPSVTETVISTWPLKLSGGVMFNKLSSMLTITSSPVAENCKSLLSTSNADSK